jgi:pimeloyl-ACP methyl ester carboxylesterase
MTDWEHLRVTGHSSYVFVHGLFGPLNDPAMFEALTPAGCSAPDLPGYGELRHEPVTLAGQVLALRTHIEERYRGRVNLVAHSIGAVFAFTLAHEFPELVASIVTVEGNFTLADAFWSKSIDAMTEDEACASIGALLVDPEAFLTGDGIPAREPWRARAEEALAFQPWRTIWHSAAAIVEATARPEYSQMLRRVFGRHPVHLVAGERSRDGWDVPSWARAEAVSETVMGNVGHMMALEDPAAFGALIARLPAR